MQGELGLSIREIAARTRTRAEARARSMARAEARAKRRNFPHPDICDDLKVRDEGSLGISVEPLPLGHSCREMSHRRLGSVGWRRWGGDV